jgi:sulfatase modifying factor 1
MKSKSIVMVGCAVMLSMLGMQGFAVCPSMDFTGDCFVDLADFAVVAKWWLAACDAANDWCEGADVLQSGSVTPEGLSGLLKQWGNGNRVPEDMVPIPAGTFQMGDSKNEGESDGLPVHTVTMDSFAMGKYEITNGQYCAFLNSAYLSQLKVVDGVVYSTSDTDNSYPYCSTSSAPIGSPNYGEYSQVAFSNNTFSVRTKSGRDMINDPMVMVSWYGAVAYCNWRSQQEGKQICYNDFVNWDWPCDFSKKGYRLATEAEWEYAARGGRSGNRFPWGDTITHSQANYYSDSSDSYDTSPTRGYHPTWSIDGIMPYTSPVGSFPANGYGLYDMAGNTWEWCNDWYSETYYSSNPQTNPSGPTTGDYRVYRGGGYSSRSGRCCVSIRRYNDPGLRFHINGFRLVLDF